MTIRYPIKPIYSLMVARCLRSFGEVTDVHIAALAGVTKQTALQWRLKPDMAISLWKADKYACKLGLHIDEIWPELGHSKAGV